MLESKDTNARDFSGHRALLFLSIFLIHRPKIILFDFTSDDEMILLSLNNFETIKL